MKNQAFKSNNIPLSNAKSKNLLLRFIALTFIALPGATGYAQTPNAPTSTASSREPSTTTEKYIVTMGREFAALHDKLKTDKRKDLVGAQGGLQTLMYVAREADKMNEAESHDESDDYHIVLEGAARFIIGGKLEGAREKTPRDWRGGRIVGGQTIQLKKGDVLFVPRGTPHQRDTTGQDYTAILIKIYAAPQPAKTLTVSTTNP